MGQLNRICWINNRLSAGQCLSTALIINELGISPATLKRDIAYLRDRMNAPVEFDREQRGYRLNASKQLPGTQYELPGLWLSPEEVHALLTMQHLLSNLDAGGLLGPHIDPLMRRLMKLIDAGTDTGAELARRIRVQTVGARRVHLPHFQALGSAMLRRQRLMLAYHARTTDQPSEREVSPQRLIHYRDNWYLDAWCHLRKALRSFSVDAIRNVQVLAQPAIDVSDEELDATLGSGYGIFAGKQVQWAHLQFSPERARWVAAESWHPRQQGRLNADGSYDLRLPYADPRELVMDILRHLPHVRVLEPLELRQQVLRQIEEGMQVMGGGLTW